MKVYYWVWIIFFSLQGLAQSQAIKSNSICINPISLAIHQNGVIQFKSWVNAKNGVLVGLQYGLPYNQNTSISITYNKLNREQVNFSVANTASIKNKATTGFQIGWLLRPAKGKSKIANHLYFACIFQQSYNQSEWQQGNDTVLNLSTGKSYTTNAFEFKTKLSKQSLVFKSGLCIPILSTLQIGLELNIGINRAKQAYDMPFEYDNEWYWEKWLSNNNTTPENLLEYNKLYTLKAEQSITEFKKTNTTNNFELKYKSVSNSFMLAPQLSIGYLF